MDVREISLSKSSCKRKWGKAKLLVQLSNSLLSWLLGTHLFLHSKIIAVRTKSTKIVTTAFGLLCFAIDVNDTVSDPLKITIVTIDDIYLLCAVLCFSYSFLFTIPYFSLNRFLSSIIFTWTWMVLFIRALIHSMTIFTFVYPRTRLSKTYFPT